MAQCTALSCPRVTYWFRDDADPNNREMNTNFSSTLATKDALGNVWCNYCQKHCALMNYGKRHNWPEVRAQGQQGRYAMLGEAKEWYLSIACGSRDLVDAFYAELIGEQEGKTA